jgi:hypothetical protein
LKARKLGCWKAGNRKSREAESRKQKTGERRTAGRRYLGHGGGSEARHGPLGRSLCLEQFDVRYGRGGDAGENKKIIWNYPAM